MTTTTRGTYRYDTSTREWKLTLDAPTAIKARRTFGRAQSSRAGDVVLKHTPEMARDIQWFMERFPLTPADPGSEHLLATAAQQHRDTETQIAAILEGGDRQVTFPATLMKTPRPYQVQAYELLKAKRRLLLGDEVGLGKTLTGLLAAVKEDARPLLVVPPTHLPRRWATELTESLPMLTFEIAKKTTPPGHILMGHLPDVCIVPYSKIDGWAPALAGRVRTVVFDEVQELRNGVNTYKGAACANITSKADMALGLTATPVYNYGGEIWNIFDILAPDALGTREEFIREWGQETHNGHVLVKDPSALGEYLRSEGLLLARTRKEVGRELPEVVKVQHTVDTDPTALAAIQDDVARLAERILAADSSRQQRFTAAGELDSELRQATGIAKAPYVAAFVKLLLESEQKVALFGWHRAVWDLWQTELAEFNPVMYTGTESPTQKARAEHEFINGDARILMMSLRSGAGVDGLQKVCNVAVFGELDWSPAVHDQAIGRFRRDGMDLTEPVVAYFLTADSGSDPVIIETLQIKRNQGEPIVNPEGKLFTNSRPDPNRARNLAESILKQRQTRNT